MKAICVLESILRRKADENFSIIESYFLENRDAVVRCSESPQASLREKANKVLIFIYFIIYIDMRFFINSVFIKIQEGKPS